MSLSNVPELPILNLEALADANWPMRPASPINTNRRDGLATDR